MQKMKPKTAIILAIIFVFIAIAFSWISSSDRFPITIPWFILFIPNLVFTYLFIFVYVPSLNLGQKISGEAPSKKKKGSSKK